MRLVADSVLWEQRRGERAEVRANACAEPLATGLTTPVSDLAASGGLSSLSRFLRHRHESAVFDFEKREVEGRPRSTKSSGHLKPVIRCCVGLCATISRNGADRSSPGRGRGSTPCWPEMLTTVEGNSCIRPSSSAPLEFGYTAPVVLAGQAERNLLDLVGGPRPTLRGRLAEEDLLGFDLADEGAAR